MSDLFREGLEQKKQGSVSVILLQTGTRECVPSLRESHRTAREPVRGRCAAEKMQAAAPFSVQCRAGVLIRQSTALRAAHNRARFLSIKRIDLQRKDDSRRFTAEKGTEGRRFTKSRIRSLK